MRNNIACFEKSGSSSVKRAKLNAKINFTSILLQIVTKLPIDFSKKAILFFIYLLADKGNFVTFKVGKLS